MILIAILQGVSILGISYLIAQQQKTAAHYASLLQSIQQNNLETQKSDDRAQHRHDQLKDRLNTESKQRIKDQMETLKQQEETLRSVMSSIREQLTLTLKQQQDHLGSHLSSLQKQVDTHLKNISGQVEKRLSEGFDKTTAVFTDVIKRLTIIDQAQQKINELSTHVVDLQSVLTDKKSRGAYGEIQLSTLVKNILPPSHYEFQSTLSNKKRVDCLLKLPEPTGNLPIDAKFPLENHRLYIEAKNDTERTIALKNLRNDIRHHIKDISEKYLIPGETSNGAVMFIPAEAIFADIHSLLPEVVAEGHKNHVWMVSPTTMMAILNTAMMVLKDHSTKKQINIIQHHLGHLHQDFKRFQKRMDQLAKHIDQAQGDVHMVHQSSKKITRRFDQIEQIQLSEEQKELAEN